MANTANTCETESPDQALDTADTIRENLSEMIERTTLLANRADDIANGILGCPSTNASAVNLKISEGPRDISSMVRELRRTINRVENTLNRF